jgi:Bacterial Ig-like domain (group 3)
VSRGKRLALCLLATCVASGLLPALAEAAPTNTTPPSISGTAQQGDTLTLTQGTWTDAAGAVTVSDAWMSCGATCTTVATTTSTTATYVIAAGDVGNTIDVVETATASADTSGTTATLGSNSLGPVTAQIPAGGTASISGTPQQGQTLTATTSGWSNTPTSYTYTWESCTTTCTAVATDSSSSTTSTYAIAATDVGHTIEVDVTATNSGGTSTAVTSAPTATVVAEPPAGGTASISGTAQQGQTLTATTSGWSNTPTSYTYTWESCTTTCTAVATDSSSTTTSTYAIAATDVGHTIEVAVTATNSGGNSTTVTSAATAAVIALAPVISVAPAITGTAQQGLTLTASTGTWTNTPTSYAYQWESCSGTTCTAITGATSSTYVVAAADVGKTIEVEVTATNTGGTSAPAASAPTAVVVPPAPTETFAPSISGTYVEGDVLTEAHGGWTNSPTSYSYQWMLCNSVGASCAAIAGATAQTYTLTSADVGGTILVDETATNAGGSGTAVSALSPVVTTPALVVPVPVNTAAPTVSGSAQQGQTLVESHGTWTENPGVFSYQWERCSAVGCTPIPGATNQTYTLTAADVGDAIYVVETAANTGGAGTAVGSKRSAVVIATSSVTLAVTPSAAVTNQTVTLAATVTSGSANSNPAGSVTFDDARGPVSGCSTQNFTANSQSITLFCQASFAAGTAQLTATYQPGAGSLTGGSISGVETLVVNRGSTSVSLAVTKQVGILKRASYVATVVPPVGNSGPTEPTGSIEFLDRGKPIRGCKSRPLKHLAATCTIVYKSAGKHRITARYGGDANFAASASPVRIVSAGKSLSSPSVLGFIGSTVRWTFYYSPKYTQALYLQVFGVASGSTLRLTCHGGGCPFSSVRTTGSDSTRCPSKAGSVCSTGSSINLLPVFQKRHLHAGAQITLSITRPNWVGKYYSFTIRAGQAPVIDLSCLAPGGSVPGAGC